MWTYIKLDKKGKPLFKHPKHGLGVLVKEGAYHSQRAELEVTIRAFEAGRDLEGMVALALVVEEGKPSSLKQGADGQWGLWLNTQAPWDKWNRERGPFPVECPYLAPEFRAAWRPYLNVPSPGVCELRHRANAYELARAVTDWGGWTVTSHRVCSPQGDELLLDHWGRGVMRERLIEVAPHMLVAGHGTWSSEFACGSEELVIGALFEKSLVPVYEAEGALAGAAPVEPVICEVVEELGRYLVRARAQGADITVHVSRKSGGGGVSGSYFSSMSDWDD